MGLIQAIKRRRTIRDYRSDPVSDEDFRQILEAVQWAPSRGNTQIWEVVVIKDQAAKEALQATLDRTNPAYMAVSSTPVVLALCAGFGESGYSKEQVSTKFGEWSMFDLGMACQNLCLAAHGLGLGTVVVGALDHDRAARVIGLPQGYELLVLVPLGYPGRVPPTKKRRSAD